MAKIRVNDNGIRVVSVRDEDYISLTDMFKAKVGKYFFWNWLRNRNTIEFLGIWEMNNNSDFNFAKFNRTKTQAGLNDFRLSAKEWMESTTAIGMIPKGCRDMNPDLRGNASDYSTINQSICLSNKENLNAVFINEGSGRANGF